MNRILNYLMLFLGVIVLILLIYVKILKNENERKSETIGNLNDELTVKTTENKTYINKNGQLVTSVIEYEKSIDELKKSVDIIELELYKTIAASQLKDRQIKAMTKIIATGQGGGVYTKIDTVYKGTMKYYKDDFISITCTEDSINYIPSVEIELIDASRFVPRKFQPFKWINPKFELRKLSEKGLVEITTNIPNSKVIIRKIRNNGRH